ncbi:MAG: ATP-grasp domain-containing protein [Alphaproteobacteria bacterium]|nr:ATP-grasp domain-containing protein [Alphaproteobacteria bacterium]
MAFDSLLIANRGEIAARIIRTARALGLRTIAVHSSADSQAPHVRAADCAVLIGPPPVADSYLNIAAILDAARRTGAGAVHPGYGFLSENAEFAAACADAGLVFVGPPAAAIRQMGNKRQAKLLMQGAGVPTVPGYCGEAQDEASLLAALARIGRPVMVKAAAGGGGRGMRLVNPGDDAAALLRLARGEAMNAFGSDELILEQAVAGARHVEVQVFADRHGNCIHLGERDCSLQRRHQKVIEEAPSPAVTATLREAMGRAAVTAAKAVGYVGAGTVEFLLATNGEFYFLEMNTRLQVEHPVTELVTGLDLVAWQLAVAAGGALPLTQDQVRFTGHAIEARLYAEDPHAGFLPQAGRLALWRPANGVRVDAGVESGQEVSPYYDPLLAKLIAHGPSREVARRKLLRALSETAALGLPTNRRFLIDLLADQGFASGHVSTDYLGHRFAEAARPAPDPPTLALAAVLLYQASAGNDGWRSSMRAEAPLTLRQGEDRCQLHLCPLGEGRFAVDGVGLAILEKTADRVRFAHDGVQRQAAYVLFDGELHLSLDSADFVFAEEVARASAAAGRGDGRMLAPMAGKVVELRGQAGQPVRQGDIVIVMEAMKMQHEIRAKTDGAIERFAVAAGEQVQNRQLLAVLKQG